MDKEVILEIRNLSVRYRTRKGPIMPVANVSLRVREGECLGIAGESGCGKSTIARMILAEIDGQGWVLVGSLNGGEASAKLNRDVSARRFGLGVSLPC